MQKDEIVIPVIAIPLPLKLLLLFIFFKDIIDKIKPGIAKKYVNVKIKPVTARPESLREAFSFKLLAPPKLAEFVPNCPAILKQHPFWYFIF